MAVDSPIRTSPADYSRYQQSFLLNRFREFYREVVRLERAIELNRSAPPELVRPDAVAPTSLGTGVWQELLTLLERQALDASQSGGAFAAELYREAQYVMAALADEIFLHLNWEGRANWPLLESRLFQTHYAGEAFFSRLDRMLQRRDPFYLDLAHVYFLALSLGFQGKYRGEPDQEPLERYRQQLFALLYRRPPQLFSSDLPLFPQSYENRLDRGRGRRLPDQRVWLALVACVLLFWFAASHLAWTSVSKQVSCLICQVTSSNCGCDGGPGR